MTESYDVVVCGAGPAGLAAAAAAAGADAAARVAIIDANARPGGQVGRHDVRFPAARAWRSSDAAAAVSWYLNTEVIAASTHELLVVGPMRPSRLRYGKLIIATGARELCLPFPGWTLPGVCGAGGLQALVKQGWPIAGRRVVVAGSGPLLLAAAALLRKHGAHVLGIHEQADARRVRAFALGLARWPATAWQALTLRGRLARVPYRCGGLVRAALGDERLRAVELETRAGSQRIECDYLAIGYGLVPNVELAELVGCELIEVAGQQARVAVDAWQRTSVPDVFAAGEVCGIGGAHAAGIEGRIAGLTAAGAPQAAAALGARRTRARRFAAQLATTFRLDARIHALATPDTLICRCEDVPLGALPAGVSGEAWDGRAAKLATRCGMGACQGRVCGAALVARGLGRPTAAAAPLFPTSLSHLTESSTAPTM
jgi:NADPH-dependent 2,4-dienoyl-CoA reductase/sulfur reductase-like enzyme